MTITVFVPDVADTARTLRRFARELTTLDQPVQLIPLAGRFPAPDQAAIYAVRSAWSTLPAASPRLVAGDVLAAFDGLPPHHITAVIQHPPEADTTLLRAVPRVVVPSEFLRSRLTRDFGVAAASIQVVPPGLDPLPRSAGSGDATCQILAVGDLIPRKGHDVLLRALARLFDLDWRLAIAGQPRDLVCADGLRALAEELCVLQRVQFVPEPDWASADLFALASHDEGYGVAVAEALRRGLPVAVTNVGAVPLLVEPEAGVVCAPGEVDQISKALRRVIFDRALRRHMAEVAWSSGQKLPDWEQQARVLAGVIHEGRNG